MRDPLWSWHIASVFQHETIRFLDSGVGLFQSPVSMLVMFIHAFCRPISAGVCPGAETQPNSNTSNYELVRKNLGRRNADHCLGATRAGWSYESSFSRFLTEYFARLMSDWLTTTWCL